MSVDVGSWERLVGKIVVDEWVRHTGDGFETSMKQRTGKLREGSAKTKYTCEGQDPEGTGETNQSNHKGGKKQSARKCKTKHDTFRTKQDTTKLKPQTMTYCIVYVFTMLQYKAQGIILFPKHLLRHYCYSFIHCFSLAHILAQL